jgi:transitional endoplasmic reticulum ATPase
MLALREIVTPGIDRKNVQEKAADVRLSKRHFEKAIRRVKPTTSRETLSAYEKSAELFARYATEFEEEPPEAKGQETRDEEKEIPSFLQAE